MEPGIYPILPNEEYHGDLGSISRSAIMDFIDSPYRYWANYLNPNKPAQKAKTPAMEFGTAFHKYILELDSFNSEYVLKLQLLPFPKVGLLRDLGREEYDRQKAIEARIREENKKTEEAYEIINAEKKILSADDYRKIQEMALTLQLHPEAGLLIKDGIYEQSYIWIDPQSKLRIKARPDIVHSNIIVDLKTIARANKRGFQSAMVEGGFHIQAAMIQDGIKILTGNKIEDIIFVCIEKEYPYCIGIYGLPEEVIEEGREVYKEKLIEMSNAIVHNQFQHQAFESIGLPGYYKRS
jgi:exodeoxyribonuclease VIII